MRARRSRRSRRRKASSRRIFELGEVSKTDTTIPAAAFELPVNKISDPVKGAFGWVIVRALSMTPGTEKTFEEVKQEIKDKFVAERSKEKLFERTTEFEDTLGSGATLEEAAKKHSLPVLKDRRHRRARQRCDAANAVEGLPGGDFVAARVSVRRRARFGAARDAGRRLLQFPRRQRFRLTSKKPFAQIRAGGVDRLARRGIDGSAEQDRRRSRQARQWRGKHDRDRLVARRGGVAHRSYAAVRQDGDLQRGGRGRRRRKRRRARSSAGRSPTARASSSGRLAEISYVPETADASLRQTYSAQLRSSFANDLARAVLQHGSRRKSA